MLHIRSHRAAPSARLFTASCILLACYAVRTASAAECTLLGSHLIEKGTDVHIFRLRSPTILTSDGSGDGSLVLLTPQAIGPEKR